MRPKPLQTSDFPRISKPFQRLPRRMGRGYARMKRRVMLREPIGVALETLRAHKNALLPDAPGHHPVGFHAHCGYCLDLRREPLHR